MSDQQAPDKKPSLDKLSQNWRSIRPILTVFLMIIIVGYGAMALADYFDVADRFNWISDMVSLVVLIGLIILGAALIMIGFITLKNKLFPPVKKPWE